MKVSNVLMFAAAVAFAAVSGVAAAQGRPAAAGKGTPHGPKVDRGAQGPKADRPGSSHGKPSGQRAARGDDRIAANISKNPQLEARVKTMLPDGMTIEQASDGFRNQGQFIAALQASKNLDINFADLKAQMTGDDAVSLGQAIQKLRPTERADAH